MTEEQVYERIKKARAKRAAKMTRNRKLKEDKLYRDLRKAGMPEAP